MGVKLAMIILDQLTGLLYSLEARAAASKRHDIVHRFGQNKDRTEAVYATTAEVEALADAVLAFAGDLDARIAARGQ